MDIATEQKGCTRELQVTLLLLHSIVYRSMRLPKEGTLSPIFCSHQLSLNLVSLIWSRIESY